MTQQPPPDTDPYRGGAIGVEPARLLIVTTGNDVAGYEVIAYLGIVRGIVVRSMGFGSALRGGLQAIGGGNIAEYTRVCEAARHDAYTLMVGHAQQLGADAIIGMRYDATEFMQASTEVLAYGTAVKLYKRQIPPA